ncbi:MAG: hypothetical protein ACRC62_08310 [Microcoleus sp.]
MKFALPITGWNDIFDRVPWMVKIEPTSDPAKTAKITSNGKIKFCVKKPIAPTRFLTKTAKPAYTSKSDRSPKSPPQTQQVAKTSVNRAIRFAVNSKFCYQ